MAQLERTGRSTDSPKVVKPQTQTSPTFEQLLRVEETNWSTSTSPVFGSIHDHEEYTSPTNNKKSVLTKVKERAKKLKHTLSGRKKHGNELSDENSTPSWGVTLDDDDDDVLDDDPEYLGAPMYESEAAPESLKETARQHPRAVPVVSEKHMVPTSMKCEAALENEKDVNSNVTMPESVSERLAPAYAAMSDATHKIASKIAGLTITTPEAEKTAATPTQIQGEAQETASNAAQVAAPSHPGYEAKKMGENSGNLKQYAGGSPQKWDKGVSVKEYFMNKLEPGEDERALSQALTDAISPRRPTGDTGVVEKVKEAVTSFFWHEEPSNSTTKPASLSSTVSSNIPSSAPQSSGISTNTHSSKVYNPSNANSSPVISISSNAHSSKVYHPSKAKSSPVIPLSTNVHEVLEEENHGKILQAN